MKRYILFRFHPLCCSRIQSRTPCCIEHFTFLINIFPGFLSSSHQLTLPSQKWLFPSCFIPFRLILKTTVWGEASPSYFEYCRRPFFSTFIFPHSVLKSSSHHQMATGTSWKTWQSILLYFLQKKKVLFFFFPVPHPKLCLFFYD